MTDTAVVTTTETAVVVEDKPIDVVDIVGQSLTSVDILVEGSPEINISDSADNVVVVQLAPSDQLDINVVTETHVVEVQMPGVPGPKGADGKDGLGSVTSVSGSGPISVSNGATEPVISITNATESAPGAMSSADKVKLDAITGTNTGDETASSIKSKLGISTLSGANTGDQVIPTSLPASDVYSWAKLPSKPSYTAAEVGAPSGSGTSSGINTGDQIIPTTLPASDVYSWAKQIAKPDYTPAEIGLGNVNNTSDANKPVSTAQQTALNLKADLNSPTFTGTVAGITAAMVGAPSGSGTSSGTNTGDQTSVSGNAGTATKLQTPRTINGVSFDGTSNISINAADTIARVAVSQLGVASGVATLDATGKVPATQLPTDSATLTAAATDASNKANAAQAAAIAASAPAAHVGAGGSAHANAVAGGAAGFMTGADKSKLDGVSGSNTGDETTATIKTKLGITTLSGSNTGDQVIPTTLPASDVYAWAKASTKPTYTAAEVGAQAAGTYATGSGTASGTNTGDETATTIKTKLGITTLSGSNTGDQVIPTTLPASDVYSWAKSATKPTYTAAEVGSDAAGTARPASDVYAWAKASTKPAYSVDEITGAAPLANPTFTGSVNVPSTGIGFGGGASTRGIQFSYGSVGETYSTMETIIGNNVYVEPTDTVSRQLRTKNTHGSYGHAFHSMYNGIHEFYGKTESVTGGSVVVKNLLATLNGTGLTLTGTIGAANFSGSSSGSNTGDQTNISGNSATTSQRTFGNVRTDGINRGSFGSISIAGSTSGYSGVDLTDQSATWMTNLAGGVSFGVYKSNATWAFYFDGNGVLQSGSIPWSQVTGVPTSYPANDVYSWAKQSTKPSYSASEVGALPIGGGNLSGRLDVLSVLTARANQTENYTTAALWTQSFDGGVTGLAFHISGVLGKMLYMDTAGALRWAGNQVIDAGNIGSQTVASSASAGLLYNSGQYNWSASSTPSAFSMGTQTSFVSAAQGFPEYGSVITTKTYSGGGGTLQMYVPYGPSNGGSDLQVRFGNYNVNGGDSWTGWKTLLASDNFNNYAPTLTGGNASGTWPISISGAANNVYTPTTDNTARLTFNTPGSYYVGLAGNVSNGLSLVQYSSPSGYAANAIASYALIHAGNYGGYSTFSGTVTASGAGGFASATYLGGARNPIWRFGNADTYGLSYFQGSAGWSGMDTIGFHFGNATMNGSAFLFRSDGRFACNIVDAPSGVYGPLYGNATTANRTNTVQDNVDNSIPGTGMYAISQWGGTNGGTSPPNSSHYLNGIAVGSPAGDPNYGFQLVNTMWQNELWFRTYAAGFGAWQRILNSSNWSSYCAAASHTHDYATHRGEGTNYIDYSRYVFDNGGSGGGSGWKEPSSLFVAYAQQGRTVYNNGAYSGSGWVEPSDLGVRYANSANLASRATRGNGDAFYLDDNYGNSIVGVYNPYRLQGLYAMGSAYRLAADGATSGNLYGLAWAHPNAGGQAANLSNHGLLVMANGTTLAALSDSIWTQIGFSSGISGGFSYGSIQANGNKGGYAGTYYAAASGSVGGMFDTSGNGGDYDNSTGWHTYWNRGNQCLGIGGSSTASGYRAYTNGNHYVAGAIFATGDITAFSDENVKTNWRSVGDNFVLYLSRLKSGIYDRTDCVLTQVGVGAQSLQKFMPNAVSCNSEGKLSVSYGHAAMVSVVELAKEVIDLKTRLAALEEFIRSTVTPSRVNLGI